MAIKSLFLSLVLSSIALQSCNEDTETPVTYAASPVSNTDTIEIVRYDTIVQWKIKTITKEVVVMDTIVVYQDTLRPILDTLARTNASLGAQIADKDRLIDSLYNVLYYPRYAILSDPYVSLNVDSYVNSTFANLRYKVPVKVEARKVKPSIFKRSRCEVELTAPEGYAVLPSIDGFMISRNVNLATDEVKNEY